MLESAYEACLVYELDQPGLKVHSQVELPVLYENIGIDVGYRCDLLVEDTALVELKSLEKVLPVHRAQLLSYLKLSGKKVGQLINFNTERLKDGISRLVNEF